MRSAEEWNLLLHNRGVWVSKSVIAEIQADALRHAAKMSHWAWKNAKTSEARGIGYNIFTTLTDQASVLEREQK